MTKFNRYFIASLEHDNRTFPVVLSAWIDHEKCAGPEPFLAKTGLGRYIAPAQFTPLYHGSAAADEPMARLLSLHLPGHVLRREEVPMMHLGPRGFQNRATVWRKHDPKLSTMSLPPGQYSAFCVEALNQISSADARTALVPHTEEQKSAEHHHDLEARIFQHLRQKYVAQSKHGLLDDETIRENLHALYKRAPRETFENFVEVLSSSDIEITPAGIMRFLNGLGPGHDRPPISQALTFLRYAMGKTQTEVAKALGICQSDISYCEAGGRLPLYYQLGELTRILACSDAIAEHFVLLARPSITAEVGLNWLQQKIAAREWRNISSPALDEAWLNAQQPAAKREGLLLRCFRERKNMFRAALGEKINVPEETLAGWERRGGINPAKLGPISQELSLSGAETERLVLLVRSDIVESGGLKWLKEKIAAKEWNHVAFPALDETWLDAQPPEKRAGLLLRDFRERAKMNHSELGRKIGLNYKSITLWETAQQGITRHKIPELMRALRLSPQEKDLFGETIALSNPFVNKTVYAARQEKKAIHHANAIQVATVLASKHPELTIEQPGRGRS